MIEIFEDSNKTYGYRRINLALKNFYGVKIAYKTIRKLMKELYLVCKVRKKKYRYISQISNKITPNILNRDFKKVEPNQAWVIDVSEFRINRKRLYLSVIQDLYNGEVKSYQISRSQNQELIIKTLKKAMNPPNCIMVSKSETGFVLTIKIQASLNKNPTTTRKIMLLPYCPFLKK